MYRQYYVGNRMVRACVTKPQDSVRTLMPVRSIVHISKASRACAGEYLSLGGTAQLLLAEHHSTPFGEALLGLKVNTYIKLERWVSTFNEVTQMSGGKIRMESLDYPAVLELASPLEDKQRNVDRKIYYLGVEVLPGDKINGVDVRRVDYVSGVFRAEVY